MARKVGAGRWIRLFSTTIRAWSSTLSQRGCAARKNRPQPFGGRALIKCRTLAWVELDHEGNRLPPTKLRNIRWVAAPRRPSSWPTINVRPSYPEKTMARRYLRIGNLLSEREGTGIVLWERIRTFGGGEARHSCGDGNECRHCARCGLVLSRARNCASLG